MPSYNSAAVVFEHTTADSDTRRTNRAVVTVYGNSELAVLGEIERQYPNFRNIVILECVFR